MSRIAFSAPTFCFPKKDPDNYCECQDRPVELTHKTGLVFWKKQQGDIVAKEEVLAEAEVEKKTVELLSPVSGKLAEICLDSGESFAFGDVLAYIDESEEQPV